MQKCCQIASIGLVLAFYISSSYAQNIWVSLDSISLMNLEGGLCQDQLQVYLGKLSLEQIDTTVPIAGVYDQAPDGLCIFRPIVPFSYDTEYTIWNNGNVHPLNFAAPLRRSSPRVTHIYPTADTLPQNLLKFHLEFSKPMATKAYDRIYLEDVFGNRVERAFLTDIPELWDPSKTILTLWLEPGRIKSGLGPSDSLGQILAESNRYRLVIEPGLSDTAGLSSQYISEKVFSVTSAEHQQIDPSRWNIIVPATGSFRPLKVVLDHPLDYHTIVSKISVQSDAFLIEGRIRPIEAESAFYFFPTEAWKAGNYTLIIDSTAEDLAGNRLDRPFERDLQNASNTQNTNRIPFRLEP